MKVLIVHNHYQQRAGEGAAVEAQIAMLHEHGHDVVLYTRDNADMQNYDLREKALSSQRTVYSQETYDQLRVLLAAEQPDVAHVHNVFPLISPSAYWALHDADVPTVQTIHNFRFLCPNGLFYTHAEVCERCKNGNTLHAVQRRCYRESYTLSSLYAFTIGLHRRWGTFQTIDRFIALTQFTAHKLVESGLTTREKVSVLGNFLPNPLPNPGSTKEREPYVVFLGRLTPEKGVETLIAAMAGLPHLGLKILGDGPQASALRTLAHQLGLDQVEFLGHVTGEAKWDLLRRATATVVPSVWYEHFPIVILESLAAGTPVVASDLGSLSHIIDDNETGLLFRLADSEDLSEKLRWLAAHTQEAREMGRQGRRVVESRFSVDRHYGRLVSIYGEVRS